MDFVPQPVYGLITVAVMPDGHYGAADPLHWPQNLAADTRFPWLVAIMKKPDVTDTRACMWRVLTPADFLPVPRGTTGLGTVSEDALRPLVKLVRDLTSFVRHCSDASSHDRTLTWLASSMRHALDRLDSPASYRDLVRQHASVQRFYLYTCAWLDWHIGLFKLFPAPTSTYQCPPTSAMMGCVTTSEPFTQSLFNAGVPVWYARTADRLTGLDVIKNCVSPIPPVACLPILDPDVLARHQSEIAGTPSVITQAGNSHLRWINDMVFHYSDVPRRIFSDSSLPASTHGVDLDADLARPVLRVSSSSSIVRQSQAVNNRFAPCRYCFFWPILILI